MRIHDEDGDIEYSKMDGRMDGRTDGWFDARTRRNPGQQGPCHTVLHPAARRIKFSRGDEKNKKGKIWQGIIMEGERRGALASHVTPPRITHGRSVLNTELNVQEIHARPFEGGLLYNTSKGEMILP